MKLLGAAAFLLMLLGDMNDALWHRRALRICFPAGFVLLAAATALRLDLKSVDAAWCAAAFAFLLLLLYSLFGSFSVKDAYVTQNSGRQVYDKGFYASCRHPGVWFFAGLYIALHYAAALPLSDAGLYIAMNLILAAVEDIYFFPRSIGGYGEYKKRVPFMIPKAAKIKEIINNRFWT